MSPHEAEAMGAVQRAVHGPLLHQQHHGADHCPAGRGQGPHQEAGGGEVRPRREVHQPEGIHPPPLHRARGGADIRHGKVTRMTMISSVVKTKFYRESACEDTERFILSSTNLAQVADILKMLENQVKTNQKRHMEMVEKISSLYERLRLDVSDKYKFLSVNQVINVYSRVFCCQMSITY